MHYSIDTTALFLGGAAVCLGVLLGMAAMYWIMKDRFEEIWEHISVPPAPVPAPRPDVQVNVNQYHNVLGPDVNLDGPMFRSDVPNPRYVDSSQGLRDLRQHVEDRGYPGTDTMAAVPPQATIVRGAIESPGDDVWPQTYAFTPSDDTVAVAPARRQDEPSRFFEGKSITELLDQWEEEGRAAVSQLS